MSERAGQEMNHLWAPRRGPAIALAAAASLAFTTAAAAEKSAEELVRQTTDQVIKLLEQEREAIKSNPDRLYQIVDEIIIPHFDFRRMSQRVLGKFWHRASDEQQTRFVSQFQTLLVRTYATALREYSEQTIEFLPVRKREDGDVSVRTQVRQQGAPPIPIEYQMYRSEDGWKVFDVSIDGVSLVINYRSTFAAEIRSKGLDGLIERLEKHNAKSR